jgi:hypothetical protein
MRLMQTIAPNRGIKKEEGRSEREKAAAPEREKIQLLKFDL